MNFDLASLAGLRKQVAELGTVKRGLDAAIEKAKRDRDELHAAPAAKADLKAAYSRRLATLQDDFAALMRVQLEPLIRRPEKLEDPAFVAKQITVLGATRNRESPPTAASMDAALVGVLGSLIADACLKAIDRLEYDEGPTLAERHIRLAALDAKIEELSTQLRELHGAARAANIVLES